MLKGWLSLAGESNRNQAMSMAAMFPLYLCD